jgi:hypothetical protein
MDVREEGAISPATPPKSPARAVRRYAQPEAGRVPDRYPGETRPRGFLGGTKPMRGEDRWYRDAPSPCRRGGVCVFE